MTQNSSNSYLNTINMLERQCLQLQLQSHHETNRKNGRPGGIVKAYRHELWSYFTMLAAKLEAESEKKKIKEEFDNIQDSIKKVNNARSPKSEKKRSRDLLSKLDEIFRDILELKAHYGMLGD